MSITSMVIILAVIHTTPVSCYVSPVVGPFKKIVHIQQRSQGKMNTTLRIRPRWNTVLILYTVPINPLYTSRQYACMVSVILYPENYDPTIMRGMLL